MPIHVRFIFGQATGSTRQDLYTLCVVLLLATLATAWTQPTAAKLKRVAPALGHSDLGQVRPTDASNFQCGDNDSESDCAALESIYESMSFARTGAKLPWGGKFSKSFCEWSYITCYEENTSHHKRGMLGFGKRNVRTIDLHNLILNGTIPPEISLLSRPQSIYLYANELSGNIPHEIGTLRTLTDLQLDQNLFSGAIPTSLGNLTSLQYLGFSFNKLSGTLPDLGHLVHLRTLKGDYNQLQGTIPESYGGLKSLVYCILSYNQLEGAVPESFGNLSQLYDLELHNNYISSLPRSLGRLSSLTSLSVGFNLLSGEIPSEWFSDNSNFEKLEGMFLENNNFTGPIPIGIQHLKSLRQLELDHNSLSGEIPGEALVNLANLETLHLNDNMLDGHIPAQPWSNLTHLVSLFLGGRGNRFVPPLPPSLEALACDGGPLSQPGTQCSMPSMFQQEICQMNPCLVKMCGMKCKDAK